MHDMIPGMKVFMLFNLLLAALVHATLCFGAMEKRNGVINAFIDETCVCDENDKLTDEQLREFLSQIYQPRCFDYLAMHYYARCFEVCQKADIFPVPIYHTCPVTLVCNHSVAHLVAERSIAECTAFVNFPPGPLRRAMFERVKAQGTGLEHLKSVMKQVDIDRYSGAYADDLFPWFNEVLMASEPQDVCAFFDSQNNAESMDRLCHFISPSFYDRLFMMPCINLATYFRDRKRAPFLKPFFQPLPGTEHLFTWNMAAKKMVPLMEQWTLGDSKHFMEKLMRIRPTCLLIDFDIECMTLEMADDVLKSVQLHRVGGSKRLDLKDPNLQKLLSKALLLSAKDGLEKKILEKQVTIANDTVNYSLNFSRDFNACYKCLPSDIILTLPPIPNPLCQADRHSFTTDGPSSISQFFKIITGHNPVLYFATLWRMRHFLSQQEQKTCWEFASLALTDNDLLQAKIKAMRLLLMNRAPIAPSMITTKQLYALHSLLLAHGSFDSHLDDCRRTMFETATKLMFPVEYARLKSVQENLALDIIVLFNSGYVDKGWLIEHFACIKKPPSKHFDIMRLVDDENFDKFIEFFQKIFSASAKNYDACELNLKRRLCSFVLHLAKLEHFNEAEKLLSGDKGVSIDKLNRSISAYTESPSKFQVFLFKLPEALKLLPVESVPTGMILPVIASAFSTLFTQNYPLICVEKRFAVKYVQDVFIKPFLAGKFEAKDGYEKLVYLYKLLKKYDRSVDIHQTAFPTMGDFLEGLDINIHDARQLLTSEIYMSIEPRISSDPCLRIQRCCLAMDFDSDTLRAYMLHSTKYCNDSATLVKRITDDLFLGEEDEYRLFSMFDMSVKHAFLRKHLQKCTPCDISAMNMTVVCSHVNERFIYVHPNITNAQMADIYSSLNLDGGPSDINDEIF